MSSTPKINKIEINNAYNIKDNNRIKHTQYSYENVDNGTIENSETFFPYNAQQSSDLLISSNYFLADNYDSTQWSGCRAKLCKPSITHLSGQTDTTPRGQTITVVGNEMIYGIYYTSCQYTSGSISKIRRAILIHTMQGSNPYFYNISSALGFQWNLNSDIATPIAYDNISDIKDLPTKSICFATYPKPNSSNDYIIRQRFADGYKFQESYVGGPDGVATWGMPYDTVDASPSSPISTNFTYYTPNYNVVIPDNLDLDADFPFYITSVVPTTRYGEYFQNHIIHNIKKKHLNNVSYFCSDLPSHIPNYYNNIYQDIKFDARLLPTKAHDIWHGCPVALIYNGVQNGYDVCHFLYAYSQFKKSGLTIRPAKLDHGDYFTDTGDCYLPTIDVNDKSELVPYQDSTSDLYAPIDVAKCEEIIQIIKNIVSTAINEVYITTYDVAYENGGVNRNYPTAQGPSEFTSKKDLSTFRNETEGNLQRYI